MHRRTCSSIATNKLAVWVGCTCQSVHTLPMNTHAREDSDHIIHEQTTYCQQFNFTPQLSLSEHGVPDMSLDWKCGKEQGKQLNNHVMPAGCLFNNSDPTPQPHNVCWLPLQQLAQLNSHVMPAGCLINSSDTLHSHHHHKHKLHFHTQQHCSTRHLRSETSRVW